VDAVGILDSRRLPDAELLAQWHAVIIDEPQRDRLLAQAVLNFTIRPKVDRALVPLHGLIVLHGPPGTGKTSLARGLAARTAEALTGIGPFLFLEVEPHALASAALGKSQRAVRDLLGGTVAEHAAHQPLIVLLDEVETLAADRSKLSMEANPIDVHRATDAVLAQLDQLAATYPNLLFIATSNFTQAVDAAFLSRADLVEYIGRPNEAACARILRSTVEAFAEAFPGARSVLTDSMFGRAAAACVGLDGRQIRKLIPAACAMDKTVAFKPETLTATHLLKAAEHARAEPHAQAEAGK
jgi:AAA+ superfamily predicted ATPase